MIKSNRETSKLSSKAKINYRKHERIAMSRYFRRKDKIKVSNNKFHPQKEIMETYLKWGL